MLCWQLLSQLQIWGQMRTTKPTVGFRERAGTKTANVTLTTSWAVKIPTSPGNSRRLLWGQRVRRSEWRTQKDCE